VQPDDLHVRTHIWWRRGCKLCLRDVSALYTHICRMLILQWSVPAPVRIVLPASYSSFENAKLFASLETSFEQALWHSNTGCQITRSVYLRWAHALQRFPSLRDEHSGVIDILYVRSFSIPSTSNIGLQEENVNTRQMGQVTRWRLEVLLCKHTSKHTYMHARNANTL
jgi:hypothetical protein